MPFPTVYLTVTDADALAPSILGLVQWSAATSTDKTNALDAASKVIDSAIRYQGRKYDPAQTLQFPRVAYDTGCGNAPLAAGPTGVADLVWDWDAATGAAVVPPAVQRACLVNGQMRWSKPRVLYPGEVSWDSVARPGRRKIVVCLEPRARRTDDGIEILPVRTFLDQLASARVF